MVNKAFKSCLILINSQNVNMELDNTFYIYICICISVTVENKVKNRFVRCLKFSKGFTSNCSCRANRVAISPTWSNAHGWLQALFVPKVLCAVACVLNAQSRAVRSNGNEMRSYWDKPCDEHTHACTRFPFLQLCAHAHTQKQSLILIVSSMGAQQNINVPPSSPALPVSPVSASKSWLLVRVQVHVTGQCEEHPAAVAWEMNNIFQVLQAGGFLQPKELLARHGFLWHLLWHIINEGLQKLYITGASRWIFIWVEW